MNLKVLHDLLPEIDYFKHSSLNLFETPIPVFENQGASRYEPFAAFTSIEKIHQFFKPMPIFSLEGLVNGFRVLSSRFKASETTQLKEINQLLLETGPQPQELKKLFDRIDSMAIEVESFLKQGHQASSAILEKIEFFLDLKNLQEILKKFSLIKFNAQNPEHQQVLQNMIELIFVFRQIYHLSHEAAPQYFPEWKQFDFGEINFMNVFAKAMRYWQGNGGSVLRHLPREFWEKLIRIHFGHHTISVGFIKDLMLTDLPPVVKRIILQHPEVQKKKEQFLSLFPVYRLIFEALFYNVPENDSEVTQAHIRNVTAIFENRNKDTESGLAWEQLLRLLNGILGPLEMSRLIFQLPGSIRKEYLKHCSHQILKELFINTAGDLDFHQRSLIVPQAEPTPDSPQLPVIVLYQYHEKVIDTASKYLSDKRRETLIRELKNTHPELSRALASKMHGHDAYFYRNMTLPDLGHVHWRLDIHKENKKARETYKRITAGLKTSDRDQTGPSGKKINILP